jgi:hypothetical protein
LNRKQRNETWQIEKASPFSAAELMPVRTGGIKKAPKHLSTEMLATCKSISATNLNYQQQLHSRSSF